MGVSVHSPVSLAEESATELRFAHPLFAAWVVLLIGLGLALCGHYLIEPSFGRWALVGLGGLLTVLGLLAAFWRHDVRLDLMTRTYQGRRGFWPSPRPLAGSLKELQGVALGRWWRRRTDPDGQDNEPVEWTVALEFQGWEAPLCVFRSRNERKAYAKLEHYARKLGVDAVDRTGSVETRRTPEALADPRAHARVGYAMTCNAENVPGAPPTGRLEWIDEGRGAQVVLPPLGFNVATLFVFLFGSAFWGMGLLAILASSRVIDVRFEGTPFAAWTVGGLFILFGGFLSFGSLIGSQARETVREVRDGLQFSLVVGRFSYRNRFVAKRGIEEVTLKPTTTSSRSNSRKLQQEVAVRADTEIVRLGEELTAEEQEWLCHTLRLLSCR